MSRFRVLNDQQWALIEGLLPVNTARKGRPWADSRTVIEAIIYRYRTGIPWRDLPECYPSWQTIYQRYRRMTCDGTFEVIHQTLLADAEDRGLIDWDFSVDATITRAHQHATNITRVTGGFVELQDSHGRAA